MDLLTKLLRWPAEAAARRRIANAAVRVVNARQTQTPMPFGPYGSQGYTVSLTETFYMVQLPDGRLVELTWSSPIVNDPAIKDPAIVEAMQDWEITHGGK